MPSYGRGAYRQAKANERVARDVASDLDQMRREMERIIAERDAAVARLAAIRAEIEIGPTHHLIGVTYARLEQLLDGDT